MWELLPDDLALAERLEALPGPASQVGRNSEQREIGSLLTWVSCFATYVAIVAEVHPGRVKDMLAYMHLVVHEAHKHGGQGWLTYDSVFWCNHQGVSTTWDIIDPSLHTAYIACQSNNPRVPCKYCCEADHLPENCALAPAVPQTRQPQGQGRPVSNSILAAHRGRRASPYSPIPMPGKVCISWNWGHCAFPGACSYSHTCPTCDSADHRARDCPKTPQELLFTRPLRST